MHDLLRRHFADDPRVLVVVEQRWRDRRAPGDRRSRDAESVAAEADRRKILSPGGRRVADRRAPAVAIALPALPRAARGIARRLTFVELWQPASEDLEDRDSSRLVIRFQAGEREVFETLYLRYFDRVYGYLRVLLKDQHEAEDATQHVFMKAFEALPSYERRERPFRAWLFRIARNRALDALARGTRLETMDPSSLGESCEEPTTDVPLDWVSDEEFFFLIERLPLLQRQALTLRYLLDLSNAEIAEVMERTPDAVRMLQHRGLSFLRRRLAAAHRRTGCDRPAPSRRYLRASNVLRARRFGLLRYPAR